MTTNPSHILIARNSRGHNAAASLTSPIETHAAAAGIFRSSTTAATGSPPWHLEEVETDDIVSELSIDSSGDQSIEVDETFSKHSKFPGKVKIVVESTIFWAHKEVLYFASPFFEAALSGDWMETARRQSISSVITISRLPSVPEGQSLGEATTEMAFTPIDQDQDPDELDIDDVDPPKSDGGNGGEQVKAKAIAASLGKLEGSSASGSSDTHQSSDSASAAGSPIPDNGNLPPRSFLKASKPSPEKVIRRIRNNSPDAVIVLKEERAHIFHDFLKYVYPHLECTITWANVEGLMNISHKLCVSTLQSECLNFLITHAAGRPIKAMRIAELFEEEELYREGSRFVLDNPGGWSDEEMGTLSRETQLKLEKRRTWFLERVLKLGLTQIAKEYQCCSTCPDPPTCARVLEERWRHAYHAVFRFGPCQPSMVYRYLRTLEGISPPLSLSHLSCQSTAKAFVATLFDRMFSLGVRGSGTETAPLGGLASRAVAATTAGPRRHFLYCTLKGENIRREKKVTGAAPVT